MAVRTFMSTARYVQGPDALDLLGAETRPHGERAAVVLDAGIASLLQTRVETSLGAAGCAADIVAWEDEVIGTLVDGLATRAAEHRPEVVVGVGGGKALDAAKGVALRLRLPMISVPTIAASDAPASRGIVLYDADHNLIAVEQMPANPVCTLVDTTLIAGAPPLFLLAGIGDAFAKRFEVAAAVRVGHANKHGTLATATAVAVSEACHATLLRHGAGGMAAVRRGIVDEHIEATVEACVLMSALAFENGGLSLAHALLPALVAAPETAGVLHGCQVALSLLHQLAIENDGAALEATISFYRTIGMPASLAEYGVNTDPGTLRDMAELNLASPVGRRATAGLAAERIVEAMRRVEVAAGEQPTQPVGEAA